MMNDSSSHSDRDHVVKEFFGPGTRYLGKDFGRALRAVIVRDLTGPVENADILDVGCGDGAISRQFFSPTNHLTLLDFSAAMLDLARAQAPSALADRADYVLANFLDHPPLPRRYDLILVIGVLAHVSSLDEAFATVARLLKPGGRVILQFTDDDRWSGRALRKSQDVMASLRGNRKYDINPIGSKAIDTLARNHGLQETRVVRYGFFPPAVARLPNSWLFRFGLWTWRNPLLTRLGTDVLASYQLV